MIGRLALELGVLPQARMWLAIEVISAPML